MAARRKKYTDDFKRDAVRMMRDRGQRTVAQVADDLGVEAGHLHRWAKKFDQETVAKRNQQGETLEEENRRLRKENERLRMEKAILKKPRPSSLRRTSRHLPFRPGAEGPFRGPIDVRGF